MTRPVQLHVTAILLAAGHGRRAGGPKALIDCEGTPLWQVRARELLDVGLSGVVAVLHPAAALVQEPGLTALHGDPDATPLHSLQHALCHCPGAALVLPVDCPVPPRTLVLRLQRAAGAGLAARPVVRQNGGLRGGHPVWLGAAAVDRIRALDAATTRLDHWLRDLGPAYVAVVTRDNRVLANFNRDGRSH